MDERPWLSLKWVQTQETFGWKNQALVLDEEALKRAAKNRTHVQKK